MEGLCMRDNSDDELFESDLKIKQKFQKEKLKKSQGFQQAKKRNDEELAYKSNIQEKEE